MESKASKSSLRPGVVVIAGLWLLLAGCGREAEAQADKGKPRVAEATRTTGAVRPAGKRDPAETIEWRDGRFATVWDPGD